MLKQYVLSEICYHAVDTLRHSDIRHLIDLTISKDSSVIPLDNKF